MDGRSKVSSRKSMVHPNVNGMLFWTVYVHQRPRTLDMVSQMYSKSISNRTISVISKNRMHPETFLIVNIFGKISWENKYAIFVKDLWSFKFWMSLNVFLWERRKSQVRNRYFLNTLYWMEFELFVGFEWFQSIPYLPNTLMNTKLQQKIFLAFKFNSTDLYTLYYLYI